MKFNTNNKVRVKLTPKGRELHRAQYEAMFHSREFLDEYPYRSPVEDENGWSEWQLWVLMRDFGPHLWNGCHVPFETEIEIP